MMKLVAAIGLLTFCSACQAQSSKIDVYTPAQLASQQRALLGKIDPSTGAAAAILAQYATHLTMLILRDKDGQSELHAKVADVIFVLDGSAELWTGGKMTGAKGTAKDEQRGTGLTGASHVLLTKGTIVHVPAGLPHQVRLPKGGKFTYFVVKVNDGP